MTKRGLGREHIHEAAWGESYPHPLISCLMPLTALLAVAAVVLVCFQCWEWSLPRTTIIPSVEGLKQAEATVELRRQGLRVTIAEQRPTNETVPAGLVISADPPAGRRVKVGRTIELVVSAGSGFATVPNVRELSEGIARERMIKAGLNIAREDYAYHETIPMDRVIDMMPKPGAKVKRRSTVTLILSKGPRPVETPAVEPEMRSTVVTVTMPKDFNGPTEARIDVIDDNGKRTVYEEVRDPGDTLVQTVQGNGEMTIEVYFGPRLILTKRY